MRWSLHMGVYRGTAEHCEGVVIGHGLNLCRRQLSFTVSVDGTYIWELTVEAVCGEVAEEIEEITE